ncbi:MAG: UDP-N-acetylglucosamine 2-epimerase (non-hydrolyzing) [Gammaproteobacteria bacterium]|nr:UDP-N-acetylglucosamine 2-epimerase (non-hydrolyzing) [Gammaproteobacteria bacterium]
MKRIAFIFGTRPETIKMAPVIHEMMKRKIFTPLVIVTGQHREMLEQALSNFEIQPDYSLDVMTSNQTLSSLSAKILLELEPVIKNETIECVCVQGDTTSTFIGALVAYYHQLPVAHIEAGLRTGDKYKPFPEEVNRMMTGAIADVHFAPTQESKLNLISENHKENTVFVTGNTSIDALLWVLKNKSNTLETVLNNHDIDIENDKFILLTTHRRENFGLPMENSLNSVRELSEMYPDLKVIMPVHFNPNVREKVDSILKNHKRVILIEPLDYVNFCHLMNKAHLIITDSGGIQEEAPSLGKPLLVLREKTERPEGVASGTAILVGTDKELILRHAKNLLNNKDEYQKMSDIKNPYGDGNASVLINDQLERMYN